MKFENFEHLKAGLVAFDADLNEVTVNRNQIRFHLAAGVVVNIFRAQQNVFISGRTGPASKLRRFLIDKSVINTMLNQRAANDALPSEKIEVVAVAIESGESVESLSHTVSLPQDIPGNTIKYTRHDSELKELNYSPNLDSELVIALVAAVGTDLSTITNVIKERLKTFNYKTEEIEIANHIISELKKIPVEPYYNRIDTLMSEGNNIRSEAGDYSILAKLAAAKINALRSKNDRGELLPLPRRAFIIKSLKHPDEVAALRTIYQNGFFLIGVHASQAIRYDFLSNHKKVDDDKIELLFKRDVDEVEKHGQHTRDTYHLSDFFVDFGANWLKFNKDVWRFIDLIFGKPFVTPTFDEFAMFMAFSASLRSADLSRQVGAVVTRDHAIVSTGANDVPKYGGGLYWPDYYEEDHIHDVKDGRDYVRKGDTNVIEKNDIIADILSKIEPEDRPKIQEILINSKLKNITEYGRVVHAEMEALLSCARGNISTAQANIYCTTFPCHNCAKHIIAAGIKKVVYVEPYPKSKALEFHDDSISVEQQKDKVNFEPFVGVGPRSFFNLFSVNLGSGYEIYRKDKSGKPSAWAEDGARLRMQMLPTSYIERESITTSSIHTLIEKIS